jgi:hypothetical protein
VGRETVNGREKHGLDVAVLLRNLCEISPDRIDRIRLLAHFNIPSIAFAAAASAPSIK